MGSLAEDRRMVLRLKGKRGGVTLFELKVFEGGLFEAGDETLWLGERGGS